MVLLVGLRHGTCEAFLGVDNDRAIPGGTTAGRLARRALPRARRQRPGRTSDGQDIVCRELELSHTFGMGMTRGTGISVTAFSKDSPALGALA